MAEIDYRPFDYFSTKMFYIDIDWSEIDKYGVTKDEVEKFLEIMEKEYGDSLVNAHKISIEYIR